MPTLITEWTRILENTTSMSADATMPTIAAGSNRLVLIAIRGQTGSGTITLPASITCNGVTANREAGDSVTRNRVAVGIYVFREADLATVSGQTIASTVSGTSTPNKAIHYKLLGDCDQGAFAAVGNDFNDDGGSSTGNLSISLARLEGSWTEGLSSSEGGAALTLTNPSKDGEVFGTGSTARINYGSIESETAGTSAFTSTRVFRATALAINIAPAPTGPSITDVNGDDEVADASSGNVITFNVPIDSLDSVVIVDADENETVCGTITGSDDEWGFVVPTLADGEAALYGACTLVVTGELDSEPFEIEHEITFTPPAGYSLVTLAADPDNTEQAVGYGIVTNTEGDQYIWETAKGEIFDDALGYTIGDQEMQVAHNSAGTRTVFTVITGEEEEDDDYPDAVTFANVTDAVLEQVYESNIVTITGINIAVDLTITGGEYKINDGEWGSSATTIEVDDTLQLRGSAPDGNNLTTTVTVNVGSRIFTWRIRAPYDSLTTGYGKLSGRKIIGRKL